MTLENKLWENPRTGVKLIPGLMYQVKIGRYTFEGTFQGIERNSIILTSGKKQDPHGETRFFEKQELPQSVRNCTLVSEHINGRIGSKIYGLTVGEVYTVDYNDACFEGTFYGAENGNLILRSGRKKEIRDEHRSYYDRFERAEIPLENLFNFSRL